MKYALIEEDLSHPSSELLALHPEGKVPLLIHGGEVIHESSIISEYLDEISGAPYLMPSDPLVRAKIRLWTYWCDQLLKPDLDQFKYEWKSLSEVEQGLLKTRIHEHLLKLNRALEKNPFLMGEELTLADIHVFPFYRQLQKAHPNFSDLFQVSLIDMWLNRVTSRPSFERVMRKK